MMRSFALVALLAGLPLAVAADPADKIPELKALAHYVGEWDTVISSKDVPLVKGTSTAKWALDGRFVQQEWTVQDKDGTTVMKGTMLATYDTDKKVYRLWTFMSDGSASEGTGTWDAKAKVLTSATAKDKDGMTTKTTADFSVDGVETWAISTTDGTGKVVFEMTGKSTRRKK
jgi:Protein of unknown function (DUF1579)